METKPKRLDERGWLKITLVAITLAFIAHKYSVRIGLDYAEYATRILCLALIPVGIILDMLAIKSAPKERVFGLDGIKEVMVDARRNTLVFLGVIAYLAIMVWFSELLY